MNVYKYGNIIDNDVFLISQLKKCSLNKARLEIFWTKIMKNSKQANQL